MSFHKRFCYNPPFCHCCLTVYGPHKSHHIYTHWLEIEDRNWTHLKWRHKLFDFTCTNTCTNTQTSRFGSVYKPTYLARSGHSADGNRDWNKHPIYAQRWHPSFASMFWRRHFRPFFFEFREMPTESRWWRRIRCGWRQTIGRRGCPVHIQFGGDTVWNRCRIIRLFAGRTRFTHFSAVFNCICSRP